MPLLTHSPANDKSKLKLASRPKTASNIKGIQLHSVEPDVSSDEEIKRKWIYFSASGGFHIGPEKVRL